MLIFVLSFAA